MSKTEKKDPTVQKFMTVFPHTIGADQPLEKAEKMMAEYRVRHLPVLDGGRLVGILSERDLRLVETLKDVDPSQVQVSEAYTPEPFITSPDKPISEVCREMVAHKFGCALVCENNRLVGIFTWVDALKAFEQMTAGNSSH